MDSCKIRYEDTSNGLSLKTSRSPVLFQSFTGAVEIAANSATVNVNLAVKDEGWSSRLSASENQSAHRPTPHLRALLQCVGCSHMRLVLSTTARSALSRGKYLKEKFAYLSQPSLILGNGCVRETEVIELFQALC